jgi:hypothetical protein
MTTHTKQKEREAAEVTITENDSGKPVWVYTPEALAANPDAQMPSWAAFIAIQAEPLDAQNPLGFLDKAKS